MYAVKSFSYDRIDKKAADFREQPPTPVPTGAGVPTPPVPGATDLDEEAGGELDFGDEDFGDDPDDFADAE